MKVKVIQGKNGEVVFVDEDVPIPLTDEGLPARNPEGSTKTAWPTLAKLTFPNKRVNEHPASKKKVLRLVNEALQQLLEENSTCQTK